MKEPQNYATQQIKMSMDRPESLMLYSFRLHDQFRSISNFTILWANRGFGDALFNCPLKNSEVNLDVKLRR